MVHARPLGDFPQPGTAGGEETARQPAGGQLPQPRLSVLGVAPQPLEDPASSPEIMALPVRNNRPVYSTKSR